MSSESSGARWYERDASHFSLDDERQMLAATPTRYIYENAVRRLLRRLMGRV